MTTQLVSLPDHLRDTLHALLDVPPPPVLTDDLAAQLRPYLAPSPAPSKRTIPYSLLSTISKHVRSPSCAASLEAHALDPRAYEMLALLAGVTTLTSARAEAAVHLPGNYERRRQQALQWKEDRRALSAVLNGLFSIGGVGFAAWYAAGSAGWRDEWRALIALFAGLVVAVSEGVLFVIWQGRAEKRRLLAQEKEERKATRVIEIADRGKDIGMDADVEKEEKNMAGPEAAAEFSTAKEDTLLAPSTLAGDNPVQDAELGTEQQSLEAAETTDLPAQQLPVSSTADEHPTLRRRAPPVGITETGSEDA